MAQVTFTIPDSKVQFFIDCFAEDYDTKTQANAESETTPFPEVDGVSKAVYARNQAFAYLVDRVRKWDKSIKQNQITGADISQ